ncbi:hypothetical protein [Microbacterium sp.]|uniref:hypothetical protein n=1 Tax=Microbacterium sp. TaxID=51671 RepID=UPI0037CB39E2
MRWSQDNPTRRHTTTADTPYGESDRDPGITDAAADDFEMGPFELFLHGDSRGA